MPRKTQGSITGAQLQPGATVTANDDGTASGMAIFHADEVSAGALPLEGSSHPKDGRLACTAVTRTYVGNGIVSHQCSYFGIISTRTRVTYSSGTAAEPIQTHPKFDTFAGTRENPRNGAIWAKVNASSAYKSTFDEFEGFNKKDEAGDFFGVTSYYTPSGQVEISYYLDRAPSLSRLMSITGAIRGFSMPQGVKNALLVDMPYRQIGENHYQVTESYLLSGKKGWNPQIYA